MHIGSEKEYIQIEEQEKLPEGTQSSGDIRVKVTVVLNEFSGSYDNVWLDKMELDTFLEKFNALAKNFSGKAKICSISPDEFWAEFRSVGTKGVFEVEVHLKRFQYSGDTYWPIIVSGGFEFDPITLPEIDSEFRQIADH